MEKQSNKARRIFIQCAGIKLLAGLPIVNAIFSEESTLTVLGKHSDHTYRAGSFRHPFEGTDPSIAAIHYPDENTFSLRLETRYSQIGNYGDSDFYDQSEISYNAKQKVNKITPYQTAWYKQIIDYLTPSSSIYEWYTPSNDSNEMLQPRTKIDNSTEIFYYEVPLRNHYDLQYTAKVYIGTPPQLVNAIWDTGSSRLLLETEECESCIGNVFNTGLSDSFEIVEPIEEAFVKYADGTVLGGPYATENICPTQYESSCVEDFKFLALNSQSGLQITYDGIMGMWNGANGKADGLIVPYLHRQGVISRNIFSFYLTNKDSGLDSYIDFGTPNEKVFSDKKDIVWLDVILDPKNKKENYWVNKINGMKWDETYGNQTFSFDETKAFTDTGTSCIIGPPIIVEYIKKAILYQLPAYKENGYWDELFSCSYRSHLPSFWLLFGEHWFEVRPEDYAVQVTASGMCALCLEKRESNDYWILGATFLRGLYSIHNHETNQMGFIPYIGSSKQVPQRELLMPQTSLPEEFSQALPKKELEQVPVPVPVTPEQEKLIMGLPVLTFVLAVVSTVLGVSTVVLLYLYCNKDTTFQQADRAFKPNASGLNKITGNNEEQAIYIFSLL